MALFDLFGRLWATARRLEDLFQLQAETRKALEVIEERLRAIEDRIIRLEADQIQVITEARGAASAAASLVAGSILSDAVTRITRLESRTDRLEQRLLPPA